MIVGDLGNQNGNSSKCNDVKQLQILFCLVSGEVHVIDGYVVPQMASWVVAWALDARDLAVVRLSTYELASLVDVGRCVWSKSSERHVE